MKSYNNIIYNMVITLVITIFVSCQDNIKEIQKFNQKSFIPSGQADTLNLRYTDSGKVKIVLQSPKMLDYSNVSFPFTEFPKGLHIILYDQQAKPTTVDANYALSYKATNVFDLQGNVTIKASDGKTLHAQQLYFDQNNQWFFTESYYQYTDEKGGYLKGKGIDFSKDFKIVNVQNSSGEIPTSETPK